MPKGFARTGVRAGMAALLTLAWLGGPPARGQEANPEELACSFYRDLLDEAVAFCLDEGCEPSEKNCDKVCKNATNACRAVAGRRAKTADDGIKGLARQDGILCATSDDPKRCRSALKSGQKEALSATRDFRDRTRANCESRVLVLACVSACNRQVTCSCPGGLVLDCGP